MDLTASVGELWRYKLTQHGGDSYMDVPLWKLPEDLRLYEHLLWLSKASCVIEIGSAHGGSALWFRDRLEVQRRYLGNPTPPLVVSVDEVTGLARRNCARVDPDYEQWITFIEADVRDADLADRIRPLLREHDRCLVCEDSSHNYDTTLAALESCSEFVVPGGWFVVEDGWTSVEALRRPEDGDAWRGVIQAVDEWLSLNPKFTRREELENWYGVTAHVGGFLQRSEA